jgi:hypothetical protein
MEFQLEVTPKITKEFLFNNISQETLMEHYLGVPVKKGLFVCPSSIRRDSKPTCAFYKNSKGNLIFKDFAGISGDAITVVMEIFQCSYYQALRIVANDFKLIPYSKMEINPPKIQYTGNVLEETKSAIIQVELKDFTEKELSWWEGFGISKDTLKKFRVFSLKSVFLNGVYFMSSSEKSPIYGYYGGKNVRNEELWRIYMPTKFNYRFLSNWSSSVVQGMKQLPRIGSSLVITKSLKDVMTLHDLDINAISPISETILISKNKFTKLLNNFEEILCFYDNDLAGVKGAQKYKKEYNIRCIFINRKYSKDVSDLWKKSSYIQKLEITEDLKLILSDKTITKTKYFYIFNGKENKRRD